ncbi:MAG: pilin [Burkholderiales bacterium]
MAKPGKCTIRNAYRLRADVRSADILEPHGPVDSLLAATIRLPHDVPGPVPDKVVRPALAVLFRVAVGPSADRYVPRFLSYERAGRGRPGWHWPSLLLPGVWAFYRRLWGPGVVFALLPIVAALAFAWLLPRLEHADAPWIVGAWLAMWILPGVVPALVADSLLYRRVRRLVRDAELRARGAADAVQRVAESAPTSSVAALLLGGGALAAVTAVLFPALATAYADLGVRAQVAQALSAVAVLQSDIESTWTSARLLPHQTYHAGVRAQPGAALIDDLDVDPRSGRVRISLGPDVPALAGRVIVLSPVLDAGDRFHWTCVPIDIAPQYLPKECRG